jgi:dihydrofolate synthase/folylpolyglutamate synthase
MKIMDYKEAIKYLYNLKIYGMSLGLERIEFLLKSLGSPQENMKAIHVAGTNGKGSVCAMLSSVLSSAGYKVGLFTSPHLLEFEERIRINGEPVSKKKLCSLVDRVKPIASSMVEDHDFEHPTFFEMATAMAFSHFFDENVDFAVIEVGLGGRLDATNVISPLICVITSVSLDHTHVLGTTLGEVAREKAGIIKEGIPVICGIEQEEIIKMIEDICQKKHCQVLFSKNQGGYNLKEKNVDYQVFDIHLNGSQYTDLNIPLLGEHQLKNAQIAIMSTELLKGMGMDIKEEDLREGLAKTKWPGRLQIIQKNPTIILDCAHNPSGMKALGSVINDMFGRTKKILIIGIMRDKDIPGIVKEAGSFADLMIITKPKFERAAEPEHIQKWAKKYCEDVKIIQNVAEAVNFSKSTTEPEDVVIISGSIFNVGESMEFLYSNKA